MKLTYREDYGNFNLCDPSEYTTNFYVDIIDDNNKIVELDGVRCRLEWSEDGDTRGDYSLGDGLETLAYECFKYAQKVWGSTDYKGQAVAFMKVFNDNYQSIVDTYEQARLIEIREKIERLTKELYRSELEAEPIDIEYIVSGEVTKLNSWIEFSVKKLEQYKEGSDLYNEEIKRIEGYKESIKKLTT